MSRIGKAPIAIPSGVTVTVSKENVVTVKGPKGELKETVDRDIIVTVSETEVVVSRPTEQIRHRAMHGLYRSLINNMVEGNLRKLYVEILNSSVFTRKGGAGLGFLIMRMKSGQPLNYNIIELSNGQSFFSVEVRIER